MNATEPEKPTISHRIERSKANLDYCKQLTTLSTGSIVLVAAFIEKGFPNPLWKPLIAVAMISFVASVIGSILAHTLQLVDFKPRATRRPKWEGELSGLALLVAWLGFLIGIVAIAAFATRNLII